mmetsp:Transcript_18699/g.47375  ORF Transcript_18699/g.47375 Transcript_18699/m.47375 type:complete len:202 (-) Transcript_18699:499-1104(-)
MRLVVPDGAREKQQVRPAVVCGQAGLEGGLRLVYVVEVCIVWRHHNVLLVLEAGVLLMRALDPLGWARARHVGVVVLVHLQPKVGQLDGVLDKSGARQQAGAHVARDPDHVVLAAVAPPERGVAHAHVVEHARDVRGGVNHVLAVQVGVGLHVEQVGLPGVLRAHRPVCRQLALKVLKGAIQAVPCHGALGEHVLKGDLPG